MKKNLLICFLSMFSIQGFAEDLSPSIAIKLCSIESTKKMPTFTDSGHLNTTYKIASIAGRSRDAKALAYFSQYPDEDKTFDAITNAVKTKIPLLSDDLSQAVVKKLHSLHGGNQDIILARRKSLEVAIKKNLESSNIWKAGLLIHAYGDTFAHTDGKFGSKEEIAYGPVSGHLFHSIFKDDPDNILVGNARTKYIAFVDSLFNVLKTDSSDIAALKVYLLKAEQTNCKTDDCFKSEVLGVQNFLGFNKFNSCMDANMKPLSKEQVLEVLNQIQ